jgi:hypothetical protein
MNLSPVFDPKIANLPTRAIPRASARDVGAAEAALSARFALADTGRRPNWGFGDRFENRRGG